MRKSFNSLASKVDASKVDASKDQALGIQAPKAQSRFNLLAAITTTAVSILPLLLASATFAQVQSIPATIPELSPADSCYIEWTAGDRTDLQNLCTRPTNTQSPRSQNRPVNSPTASQVVSPTQPASPTTVRILSEVGSAVYVNGVPIFQNAQRPTYLQSNQTQFSQNQSNQTQFSQSQPGFVSPTYFQYPNNSYLDNYPSRKYVQYQRFYPYQLPQQPFVEHQPYEVPQQTYRHRRRFSHY